MAPSKYPGRRVEIRLPSEEEKKKLEEVAKAHGATVPKFILYAIDLASRPARPQSNPGELQTLREENSQLRRVVGDKELLLSQKESELQKLRGGPFLHKSWDTGIDADLLKALRAGPVHDHRLLDILGATDPEAIRAISRQLQILETSGFIARTTKGWSWKR
ncbi:MAG: hypothetical protein WA137_06700 [Methanothrix sp.]